MLRKKVVHVHIVKSDLKLCMLNCVYYNLLYIILDIKHSLNVVRKLSQLIEYARAKVIELQIELLTKSRALA